MTVFDFIGSVGCAAASVPMLVVGNMLEGIGILTDVDMLANGGQSIAEFSDVLMEISEETMFSQKQSPLHGEYSVPTEYFGCSPITDASPEP